MSNGSRKIGGSRPGERRGNAGKGRPKGRQNKVTKDLREMTMGALDELGGQKFLVQTGKENPVAFLVFLKAYIPQKLQAELKMTLENILTGKPHE